MDESLKDALATVLMDVMNNHESGFEVAGATKSGGLFRELTGVISTVMIHQIN